MKVTPSLPKGTRDFGPDELRKRNYIFGVIKSVFEKYGFQPLETPVMENLSTLTGKYGEEGDKLLFRILNSGDFLKDVSQEQLSERHPSKISHLISEKGLRYDLTIPFARYVVQHQHEITFPFRRYQIQPVWRADRPQKGRYREFYQCDADVIGSDSLLNEVELILIYDEVFDRLKMQDTSIKMNNRKILVGIAEKNKIADKLASFTIALDKLDKIGADAVKKELEERGISTDALDAVIRLKNLSAAEKISFLENYFADSETGKTGLNEIKYILAQASPAMRGAKLEFDITLARGLDYYTGAIFEVKANPARAGQMGSIGGGGRYDNLTGVFGLPGVSGVGISFGVERIYDVMEELKLFDNINLSANTTRALFINFGGDAETKAFQYLQQLRANDIPAEIFPSAEKMKKQIGYADKKGIPFALFVGEEELKNNTLQIKNLRTGEQSQHSLEEVISKLKPTKPD